MNYPQRANQRVQNRDVNAASRAVQAMNMRIAGKGFKEISDQCGYGNPGTAHRAIMRELDRIVVTNVEELRKTELHRLEVMHEECWLAFMDRKNKGRFYAADRILAIMERRAKLMGLDVPVENAIAANMVVIREMPQGYLGLEQPAQ